MRRDPLCWQSHQVHKQCVQRNNEDRQINAGRQRTSPHLHCLLLLELVLGLLQQPCWQWAGFGTLINQPVNQSINQSVNGYSVSWLTMCFRTLINQTINQPVIYIYIYKYIYVCVCVYFYLYLSVNRSGSVAF